jgi:hypothetical protein
VDSDYFKSRFGVVSNQKAADAISSNVVSVLQAGAFFGAIGSAFVSG